MKVHLMICTWLRSSSSAEQDEIALSQACVKLRRCTRLPRSNVVNKHMKSRVQGKNEWDFQRLLHFHCPACEPDFAYYVGRRTSANLLPCTLAFTNILIPKKGRNKSYRRRKDGDTRVFLKRLEGGLLHITLGACPLHVYYANAR